ncbi:MAG: hypothetical protein ACE5F3_05135 [Mariprofundaceae bacterium]
MIARRLAEALLFLETSSRTAGDREYAEAIKRIIEEHAEMREALEAICCLPDAGKAAEIANIALEKTVDIDAIEHDLELRDALLRLSDMLLEDEHLQKARSDRTWLNSLMRKLPVRQHYTGPRLKQLLLHTMK